MSTDQLQCLRVSAISIAIWSIIYSLIELAIMCWQAQVVSELQWEYEHRQIPNYGGTHSFQQRFPGLYHLYTETPERRRINAMYVIVIVILILAAVHLALSFVLLYGAHQRDRAFIWPWFLAAVPVVIMSTAYAVLWWSGDVFNEQLMMSLIIFVLSFIVNSICVIIVLVYFMQLKGQFAFGTARQQIARGDIPPWRYDWDKEEPPAHVLRSLRRKSAREHRSSRSLDRLAAPPPPRSAAPPSDGYEGLREGLRSRQYAVSEPPLRGISSQYAATLDQVYEATSRHRRRPTSSSPPRRTTYPQSRASVV